MSSCNPHQTWGADPGCDGHLCSVQGGKSILHMFPDVFWNIFNPVQSSLTYLYIAGVVGVWLCVTACNWPPCNCTRPVGNAVAPAGIGVPAILL